MGQNSDQIQKQYQAYQDPNRLFGGAYGANGQSGGYNSSYGGQQGPLNGSLDPSAHQTPQTGGMPTVGYQQIGGAQGGGQGPGNPMPTWTPQQIGGNQPNFGSPFGGSSNWLQQLLSTVNPGGTGSGKGTGV